MEKGVFNKLNNIIGHGNAVEWVKDKLFCFNYLLIT